MYGTLSREPKDAAQAGSSLLEVLIALLIFSIVMLGVARLQVEAQQNVRLACLQRFAVWEASNALELLRVDANPGHQIEAWTLWRSRLAARGLQGTVTASGQNAVVTLQGPGLAESVSAVGQVVLQAGL